MDLLRVLGTAAGALMCVGYLALVVDAWRDGVAPNGVTWLFAATLSALALEGQWRLGASWSLLMVGVQVAGAATMLGIALLRRWSWTSFDGSMLVLAALVLGVRLGVDRPALTVWLTVGADVVAMLPCLRDAWRRPDDVARRGWWLSAGGGALAVAAVGAPDVTLLAYPVYIVLVNLAVIAAATSGARVLRNQARGVVVVHQREVADLVGQGDLDLAVLRGGPGAGGGGAAIVPTGDDDAGDAVLLQL